MEDRRTCSRPALQHDRHRLVGGLRVPLQKAVESQEHASVCVVAESPRAHQRDVIAHQVAEHAAELRQLSQRFQRSALSGSGAKSARTIVALPFIKYLVRSSAI